MCQKRNSNLVKIIDFGLATKLDPHEIVKISTGTAEFAAPEIVEREAVGFYTDMWACGVLTYVLLSGLTPFAGENDIETLKNIRQCQWEFDPDAFKNISDEGKDFIKKLLTKEKEKRMTAHECLEHPWLKQMDIQRRDTIAGRKFEDIRDRIRAKYPTWDKALVPLGHIANYSSLRKLQDEKYKLHDAFVDRREMLPRFVLKPQSTIAYEGQSAKFYCRVIAAAPPTLSWYREGMELRQSVKFMKRYAESDFTFIINRCKLEDRGEYIIRAENHYGSREEPVFLNVLPIPKEVYRPPVDEEPRRRRVEPPRMMLDEPGERGPMFTFHLRTRIIQMGVGVRLLCCLEGKPWPQIKWLKDGRELSRTDYTMKASDGIVTLDIVACRMEDAGKYTCIASNNLGTAETSCAVVVEPKRVVSPSPHWSPNQTRLSTPIPTVLSPMEAYYKEGGASTTIRDSMREARASSVYTPRRKESISSSYSGGQASTTSSISAYRTAAGGYQTATTAYSSTSSALRRHYSRTTSSDRYDRFSSTTGRAESPISSYLPTSYSRPSSPTASYRSPGFPTSITSSTGRSMRSPLSHRRSPLPSSFRSSTPTSSFTSRIPPSSSMVAPSATSSYVTPTRQRKSLANVTNVFTEPEFSTKLSDRTIRDGEQLRLMVQVRGDPEPKIEWLKDGKRLQSSDVVDLKYRTGMAILTIEEAFPEDEGRYECIATNSEGKATTKCFITVKADKTSSKKPAAGSKGSAKAPRIASHIQSLTVLDGQPATLRCTIKCESPFDVVWLHNGQKVVKSADFKYSQIGDDYLLELAECFPEDSGTYTCEAFNDAGDTFSTGTVLVKAPNEEKPSLGIIQFPRSVTSTLGSKASFQVETDQDVDKVQWLHEGLPVTDSVDAQLSSTGKRNFKMSISSLRDKDIGQYLVKLTTKDGKTTNVAFAIVVIKE